MNSEIGDQKDNCAVVFGDSSSDAHEAFLQDQGGSQ
jgi:hypothetical protein